MRALQRQVASGGPVVAEGRDIGSVVFRAAQWKFYLDADPGERARRRQIDFARVGRELSTTEVRAEIDERDEHDRGRAVAPLACPEDAVRIDSTGRSVDEIVREMRDIVLGPAPGSAARPLHHRVLYRGTAIVNTAFFRVYFRLRLHDWRRLPAQGGAVLAVNHASYLDPMFVGSTSPRPVCFLARDTLARFPVFGSYIRALGTMFVDRDGSARAGLRVALSAIQRGEVLCMFPEGTRTRTGKVGPFKRGLLWMLKSCPVPVIPIGLRGTHRAWPRGALLPRPSRCSLHVGEPMQAAEVLAPGGIDELRRRVCELAGEPVGDVRDSAGAMEHPAHCDPRPDGPARESSSAFHPTYVNAGRGGGFQFPVSV